MENKSAHEVLKESILSKPRMMGTPGEKETTEFLTDYLEKNNIKSHTEQMDWSNASVIGRKILFIFAIVAVLFLNYAINMAIPTNAVVSLISIPIILVIVGLYGKQLFNDKLRFLGKTSIGNNVICEINPKNKEKEQCTEIYLTAHSDSVSVSTPSVYIKFMIGMLVGLLLIFMLVFLNSIISLVDFFWTEIDLAIIINIINIIIIVVSIPDVSLFIFMMLGKRLNKSSGACDNGSGCVILLKLAEEFSQDSNKLENSNLTFIWCAGEEWGLFGSKSYANKHKEELLAKKDRFYLINVDMVGCEVSYLGKSGLLKKKPINKKLNNIIKEIAKEKNIEAREFKSMIGGNSDHASFQKIFKKEKDKPEICTFTSKKDTKIIHSSKDNIDAVKPEKLDDAIELLKSVIQKLDQK